MHRGLINHKKKLIMFWSPKVACQHQKKWFIKSNGIFKIKNLDGNVVSTDSNSYNPHYYCQKDLSNLNFKKMNDELSKYYKFIIIRDPAERLVSFYKDKIVMQRWDPRDSKRKSSKFSLYSRASLRGEKFLRGRENMRISPADLSFNDLVTLMYRHKREILHFDNHIGLQKKAFSGIKLDFIGTFSNFKKDFGFIEKKFNCYLDIMADNSTDQSGGPILNISSISAGALRGRTLPAHSEFLNKSNLRLIKEIYKHDYKILSKADGG